MKELYNFIYKMAVAYILFCIYQLVLPDDAGFFQEFLGYVFVFVAAFSASGNLFNKEDK